MLTVYVKYDILCKMLKVLYQSLNNFDSIKHFRKGDKK